MSFFASAVLSLLIAIAADLTVTVNVTDTNGKPVSGALVLLENTTDQKKWEGVTTESGGVHFDRLQIGSYVIRIVKDGYYPGDVDLRAEASKVVDFTLSAVEMRHEEVEVIARPEPINADAVAAQQTINDEVIQNLPYTGRKNFLNALSLMPGVVRDNGGELHIHGSGSDQIRYRLDGINVTDPSGGLASNIPFDAIVSCGLALAGFSAGFGRGAGRVVR